MDKYRVSNLSRTFCVCVLATNLFEARDKVKRLTGRNDIKLIERVDDYDDTDSTFDNVDSDVLL